MILLDTMPPQATTDQIAGAWILIAAVVLMAIGMLGYHFAPLVILGVEQVNAFIMSRSAMPEEEEDAVPSLPDAEDGQDGQQDDADEIEPPADRRAALVAVLGWARVVGVSRDEARATLRPLGLTFSNALWAAAAPQPPQPGPQVVAPWSGRAVDPALFPADPPPLAGVEPQPPRRAVEPAPQETAAAPQAAPQAVEPLPAALRYVPPQEFDESLAFS